MLQRKELNLNMSDLLHIILVSATDSAYSILNLSKHFVSKSPDVLIASRFT